MVNKKFWQGKQVLITGHTGFKGSWLSLWLHLMQSQVVGYSLAPPTIPNLFDLAQIEKDITSIHGDVRDLAHLQKVISTHQPEIIFNMAAQALVRKSYLDPVETYSTNLMGTVNLLEAVRQIGGVRVVINVTSDKCYANKEWVWGYREIDPMGGDDPYASSKGCAELITGAFRHSFFNPDNYDQHGVALASVRAGNVIGGGDWAEDRLIPDIVKAFLAGGCVKIRYPQAQRPWQHVLEPLRGYLMLAEKLATQGPEYAEAWNFGPRAEDARPVHFIVSQLKALWGPEARWELGQDLQPSESRYLHLDCSKTRSRLGWEPVLNLEQALDWTVSWYKNYRTDPGTARRSTESQIIAHQQIANGLGKD